MNKQLQMVEIKCGTKSWLFADVQDAKDFVMAAAAQDNCSVFRYFEVDGIHHYDCGPKTFTSTVKLLNF
jgi:hypothetical protein